MKVIITRGKSVNGHVRYVEARTDNAHVVGDWPTIALAVHALANAVSGRSLEPNGSWITIIIEDAFTGEPIHLIAGADQDAR